MKTSPPSPKRIRLDPSLSPNDEDPKEDNDLEQEHCAICLQPFIDRTIIPVCAHEFCFECILLWSEQSRKCPLCSRSFDNSYLIHHIRSQYDYQKHHLPPPRSSPSLPLTAEFRANALRNTRRERQWGRRQRQQREEADQLDRAIARRRWIYHHHLYAKHIASNPYTRYRPFPTPAQFTASPDLISRMTMFLRRELRVWPNLDVEFLTTYTISLMKSIDIRSESAVRLLSEFLDLDTPYAAGERHVNAEHFAHEIYSYLRSPYRDLNTYDQTAQYDTPPEISPPQEIERRRRWSAEPSPSRRTRSQSNYRSPVPHRENGAGHSPAARHGTDSSAETRREDIANRRHSRNRSPRSISPDREHHDPRNHPVDGVQVILRSDHSQPGGLPHPEASSSAVLAEDQDINLPVQLHSPGYERGKSQVRENMEEFVPATAAQKVSVPQSGDSAAALAVGEAGVTRLVDGPPGNDYVDKVRGGSSANPQPSRKRSAGLSDRVHPRNRTLSESIQAYLSRPAPPQHPTKKPSVSRDKQPTRALDTGTTGKPTTDTRPSLLLRLTDGPTDPDMVKLPFPRKTPVGSTANGDLPTHNTASEQQLHGCRSHSRVSLLKCGSSTVAEHLDGITQHGDCVDDRATRSRHFFPSTADELPGASPPGDPSPQRLAFPHTPSVKPVASNANDVTLSHALALKGFLVGGRLESVQTPHGELLGQGHFRTEMGAVATGDQAQPGDGEPVNGDALDLHTGLLGKWSLLGGAAVLASLDDHEHKRGQDHGRDCTNKDIWPGVDVPAGAIAAGPSVFHGGQRATAGDLAVGGGLGDIASKNESTLGSGSGSGSVSTSTDADASELETRLRMRARLRVRLAAMKGTGGVGSMGPVSVSVSGGSEPGLGMDSGLGPGRRGTRDDSTVHRVDRVRDPSASITISGDRDDGDEYFGPDQVRDGDSSRDKDKDKVGRRTPDLDKERQREVALRGMLMVRERAAWRG